MDGPIEEYPSQPPSRFVERLKFVHFATLNDTLNIIDEFDFLVGLKQSYRWDLLLYMHWYMCQR